ncbi:hypothetical protein M426DRAFT_23539 [Hypoxylon sp. CI-4A]|nr:hypothetical protein M426DRAFT_23539 [Hypoxylon sp. CI-4A]
MSQNTTHGSERSTSLSAPAEGAEIKYYEIGSWAEVENVDLYNKGGLYPVDIGDILGERFEVVHKLGYGGFSTVWLCLDVRNQTWKSVKIMTADHSAKENDLKIVSHLREKSSLKQIEENHIDVPHEQFWIESANGRHLCFVTEVYGNMVSYWAMRQDPTTEETRVAKTSVCRQIVKGVRFLHNRGIAHGDLKPANILMKLRSLDGITKEQMLELTGEPEQFEIETVSGEDPRPHAPEYCVGPISWDWCDKFTTDSIVICDLGESFHVDAPPETTGIPELFAAPEILLEGVPGAASDIWSLACTIFEIRTGDTLFAYLWGSTTVNLLNMIASYLGPMPEPYKSAYRRIMTEQYGKTPKDIVGSSAEERGRVCPFEKTLSEERHFSRDVPDSDDLPVEEQRTTTIWRYSQEEVSNLGDLMRKMIKYDPAERIDIDEVFHHPWLKEAPDSQADDTKSVGKSKSFWALGISITTLSILSHYFLGFLRSKTRR